MEKGVGAPNFWSVVYLIPLQYGLIWHSIHNGTRYAFTNKDHGLSNPPSGEQKKQQIILNRIPPLRKGGESKSQQSVHVNKTYDNSF